MLDDYSARQALAADLNRDERLLWVGRPAQGIRFRTSDAFLIPFSLLWGGFALSWEAAAIGFFVFGNKTEHGAGWFDILWGIPFVTIGLYMIVGRFFWDAHARRRTVYGVGTRRILIKQVQKLTVLDLLNLPAVQLSGDASAGHRPLPTAHV